MKNIRSVIAATLSHICPLQTRWKQLHTVLGTALILLLTAICSELYCSFTGKDSRVSEALVNLPKVSDLKSRAFS